MLPPNIDQSTISKVQEAYWTTKHVVLKKLGIKEDEHLIASDAQLDAKLEVRGTQMMMVSKDCYSSDVLFQYLIRISLKR